jgi:thiamine pyrophosphate-dependent acetolactate synthase large subunit-like protein
MSERRNAKTMNRFDLTKRLFARLKNEVAVIGGIGNSNFDLFGAGKRPQNFYMLGSMGLACPIALGVALAQKQRRVFALEGDGSLLMQLGALATIAMLAPKNLAIVVWDNGMYQITGSQKTATSAGADVVEMARGAGIKQSAWASDEKDFERSVEQALKGDGPWFIGARIDGKAAPQQTPREPVIIKDAFMRGLGVVPPSKG